MFILLSIYTVSVVGLIIFDVLLLLRLPFYRARNEHHNEPVSVIICAKNEAENLRVILPLLHSQDFDQYEILVVDDASTDSTLEVLKEHSKLYSELRFTSIDINDPQANQPGKKAALARGIELAKFDVLLLTDADCKPLTKEWIKGMTAQFGRQKLVLGYSPFEPKNGLSGWLSTWDNFETAMLYFGFALAGMPYMGIGRNLAYRKSLFHQNSALGHDAGLASGDDDLQVGAMADSAFTGIEFRKPFATVSIPALSFGQWWSQKRRHLTTSIYYKPVVRFLLAFFGASKLMFYTLLPLLVAVSATNWLLYLVLTRLLLHYIILMANATKLEQWRIIPLYPLWEFLSTFLLALIHIANFIKPKKDAWS